MSEVISSFKSLRAGSQVLALRMLFLCVILHSMWSGKSPQLLCILLFGMLCLCAIRMMFCENDIVCVYVGGWCGLNESVVCPCQFFCSAWMYCLEEVYKCLQL